jgi:hypothetical protein
VDNPVETSEIATWTGEGLPAEAADFANALENGKLLWLPRLAFDFSDAERALLSPASADGRSKNISYDCAQASVRGSMLSGEQRLLLTRMMARFHAQARQLICALMPAYRNALKDGLTSFRPFEAQGRPASITKDDTRLHVDAFASRPNHGARLLRVFSNVNPHDKPRVWEIGEPFQDVAARYTARIKRQPPGSARILSALHITKGRRSEYDHIMLQLHDHMKRDTLYQGSAPRVHMEFPPGSTWICFSDQVPHAALGGQFLLEQTFYLPVQAMLDPSKAPLRVLERIFQRALV